MNYILILSLLFMSTSCSADISVNNSDTVNKLLHHFFPSHKQQSNPIFKLGDFNGDGLEDIAVLFTPSSKPTSTAQLKVSMPWIYLLTKKTNKLHKSLVVFQKTKKNWLSESTQVFAFLDTTGVLETPSFQLLISSKGDKDYKEHARTISIKTSNDLIILPTEAGIDTYIFWDKNTYKYLEPEEIP